MRGGLWQAGLALGLAVALHLGAFALRPGPAGAVASGEGGDALVSVQAADAGLVTLVAAWDAPPPAVAPVSAPIEAPALPQADALPMPAPEAPPVMAALAPPAMPVVVDALPDGTAALPPPVVVAEPPKPAP
jgi:periplasmic protein TonB